jgi:hypothetical protein
MVFLGNRTYQGCLHVLDFTINIWMHDMQSKVRKTIRNALVLSIGLHVILVLLLTSLHQSEPSSIVDKTYLEISEVRPQRTLRTIKRVQYTPLKYTPTKHKQISVTVDHPIASLPAALPIVHRNPVTPIRGFTLPNLSTIGIHKSGSNFTTPTVNHDIGSQRGFGKFDSKGLIRRTKQQSFKPPVDDTLPDISDLSMPNVILARIGQHVLANRTADLVDIVFIIDGSGSMKDNINAVRNHLSQMTKLFDDAELDFTLGIVIFRDNTGYNMLGWDFELVPQTRSVSQIKRFLGQVKCRGGEKALDALMRAADEVTVRRNTNVHFILITDEYVSGNYSAKDVLIKMTNAKIKVDVIGRDEPFQKFITRSTGGLFLPISSLEAQ